MLWSSTSARWQLLHGRLRLFPDCSVDILQNSGKSAPDDAGVSKNGPHCQHYRRTHSHAGPIGLFCTLLAFFDLLNHVGFLLSEVLMTQKSTASQEQNCSETVLFASCPLCDDKSISHFHLRVIGILLPSFFTCFAMTEAAQASKHPNDQYPTALHAWQIRCSGIFR